MKRRPLFDMNDRFFFGGVLLAALGGCWLSVPITCIVLGAVLAVVGLRGGL